MKTFPKHQQAPAPLTLAEKEAAYEAFLKSKVPPTNECGFQITPEDVHPLLKPHQRDVVRWAVRLGRAAIFEAFGLRKTLQQLEILRLILKCNEASRKQDELFPFNRGLIVAPLGVRQEFIRDAKMIGYWLDSVMYAQNAEAKVNQPTLFDLLAEEEEQPA